MADKIIYVCNSEGNDSLGEVYSSLDANVFEGWLLGYAGKSNEEPFIYSYYGKDESTICTFNPEYVDL